MKTRFQQLMPLVLAALMGSTACEKSIQEQTQAAVTAPKGEMTILGKQYKNPYSPSNLAAAWERLQGTKPDLTKGVQMDFTPTHRYIVFSPSTQTEVEQLQQAYGADVSDIPSFYEIEKEGSFYRDAKALPGKPGFQYAILPYHTALPTNIAYEVKEELVLFHNEGPNNLFAKYGEELVLALEQEALKRVGYSSVPDRQNTRQQGVLESWTPSGEVRYNDCSRENAGKGARVSIRDAIFIPIMKTITVGDDGKFQSSKTLRAKVFYRVSLNYTIYKDGKYSFQSGSVTSNFIKRAYKVRFECNGSASQF